MVLKTETGEIEISMNAIRSVVYKVMISTFGLVDVSVQNLITRFFGREEEKGIKIVEKEDGLQIDLFVILEYGVVLPKVAQNLQENVFHEMKNTIGIEPQTVNVHILGLSIE
ncbi:MAG: hypothetical protein PWQ20_933 [Thermotogaceae bacterium]|nr:hypothetical protein [Thermotogaceae bacterium]